MGSRQPVHSRLLSNLQRLGVTDNSRAQRALSSPAGAAHSPTPGRGAMRQSEHPDSRKTNDKPIPQKTFFGIIGAERELQTAINATDKSAASMETAIRSAIATLKSARDVRDLRQSAYYGGDETWDRVQYATRVIVAQESRFQCP